jgi:hypothetical protein
VQQIDAQGPAVVERISNQFADVACTPENARQLVEALHSGKSVTLSANGKSTTFSPAGSNLGYGEAYIALALAAEALRDAGVTGCATPEQWRAVLLGGPLAASGTTSTSTSQSATSSSSSQFPGILTLHSQGQGWGQVAQAANVQLGQVVSSAHSSLNVGSTGDTNLAPTGRSSADMSKSRASSSSTDTGVSASSSDDDGGKGKAKGKGKGKGKAKGQSDPQSTSGSRDDTSSSPENR